jgi:hypothetical protein
VDELMRRVEAGFVPVVSDAPGFIAYYAVAVGDGMALSINIFESQADAEESNRLAASWVRENIAQFVAGPPEITAGEVIGPPPAGAHRHPRHRAWTRRSWRSCCWWSAKKS